MFAHMSFVVKRIDKADRESSSNAGVFNAITMVTKNNIEKRKLNTGSEPRSNGN